MVIARLREALPVIVVPATFQYPSVESLLVTCRR